LTSAHRTERECLYIRFTRLVPFRALAAGPSREGKNGPIRKRVHRRPKTTSKSEVNIALVPASDFYWSLALDTKKVSKSKYIRAPITLIHDSEPHSSPSAVLSAPVLLVSSDQRPTSIPLWLTSKNPVGQNKHSVGCKREEATVHLWSSDDITCLGPPFRIPLLPPDFITFNTFEVQTPSQSRGFSTFEFVFAVSSYLLENPFPSSRI
jgi:hypothetical protein